MPIHIQVTSSVDALPVKLEEGQQMSGKEEL
jgi:hypothetical protein